MSKPSDPLMGLKCFSIAGRMAHQRQRCLGMTDEERRWRAQYLKDQVLSPEEPKIVPEYYKDTTNIFRRIFKAPFNFLQKALEPIVGKDGAFVLRRGASKGLMLIGFAYLATYYGKYHANDFIPFRTPEIVRYGRKMYPDHPDYPNLPEKKNSDYYDQGFYSSVLCQEVVPPPVVVKEEPKPAVIMQGDEVIECDPTAPEGVKADEQ